MSKRTDGSSSRESSGYVYEQQNDEHLNDLHGKLSALKNITIGIQEEATGQNRLLDDSHGIFSGLGSSVQGSFGRLNRMVSTRRQRQLCSYVGIVVLAFFILYWLSGLVRSFAGSSPHEDGQAL